jgi:hypothetical protein
MLTLRATSINWLNGSPLSAGDLCAHGKVELRVDDATLVAPGQDDITLSAAALYLLRTLKDDHTPEDRVAEANLLFPCCGHAVFKNNGRYGVVCVGCPNGVDVYVRHDDNRVILQRAGQDAQHTVSLQEWRRAVLSFVVQVEQFYETNERSEPSTAEDEEGWRLFWQEWQSRAGAARSEA